MLIQVILRSITVNKIILLIFNYFIKYINVIIFYIDLLSIIDVCEQFN